MAKNSKDVVAAKAKQFPPWTGLKPFSCNLPLHDSKEGATENGLA
ncbi:MAG: hypothetical protein ACYC9O_19430 [Candidatus Latescibacterota bacterium]